MMLFSIIVATKNNIKTIEDVLESTVRFGRRLPTELIIVDGQSSDGSCELIDKFIKTHEQIFKRIEKTSDQGLSLSNARNLGFKHSTGDLQIFIDGDTMLANDFSENLHKIIDRGYDIIAPQIVVLEIDSATKMFSEFNGVFEDLTLRSNRPSIIPPARIYKRIVLERSCGYPQLSSYFAEDRLATTVGLQLGFKYLYEPSLRINKIDDAMIQSYFKKHIRYGQGIHKDLQPAAKNLLKDYIIFRKLTYLNIFVPIIAFSYALKRLNPCESWHIFVMKWIIDFSMFLGELKAII
jgi:glycosyltransferase involved in cell wall biosynthesis